MFEFFQDSGDCGIYSYMDDSFDEQEKGVFVVSRLFVNIESETGNLSFYFTDPR